MLRPRWVRRKREKGHLDCRPQTRHSRVNADFPPLTELARYHRANTHEPEAVLIAPWSYDLCLALYSCKAGGKQSRAGYSTTRLDRPAAGLAAGQLLHGRNDGDTRGRISVSITTSIRKHTTRHDTI